MSESDFITLYNTFVILVGTLERFLKKTGLSGLRQEFVFFAEG